MLNNPTAVWTNEHYGDHLYYSGAVVLKHNNLVSRF